jgi:hypothetical protein
MPSVWFWGSGLNKDSVCLGSIGFIIHYIYAVFIKKQVNIKNIIPLVVLVYIVLIIKSYIIIILAVGVSVYIFNKFVTPFKNIVIRAFIISVFLFGVLIIAFVTNISDQVQLLAEESMMQVESFRRNYDAVQNIDERSRGNIMSRDLDLSFSSLITQSPVAIFTCLFRPFLWESRKVVILLGSLESLLLLYSTLYVMFKLKFLGFFREIFNNPFVLTSFIISILFAMVIGFTTYNFGTMARYKIILLPFYLFTLVSLYTTSLNKMKPAERSVG